MLFTLHPLLMFSHSLFAFADVRFGYLLGAGACAFVLLSVVVVCARCFLCLFSFVCFLRSCAGLHRLLFGSEATVVFVGVSCGGPGGNEQMAHSQIVVAIAFSLTFEMDVALVRRRRPLGKTCFQCRFSIAVYHHLFRYVMVCFRLF